MTIKDLQKKESEMEKYAKRKNDEAMWTAGILAFWIIVAVFTGTIWWPFYLIAAVMRNCK